MNLKYFYTTNLFVLFFVFNTFSAELDDLIESERMAIASEDLGKKTKFIPIKSIVKFKDLVGDIPYEIEEIVDEIKYNISSGMKIKTHKIILFGLPGGGKTILSKAIAGELDCDLYNVPAGLLINKYVGSSSENINNLFKSIKKANKLTVLFIDEIDGLANKNHAEQQSELTRAIHALHLIDEIEENLICILATNKIENLPETIITRYGENQINIPLPDKIKIAKILEKLLREYIVEDGAIDIAQMNCEKVNCRQLEMIAKKAFRIALFFHKKNNIQDQLVIKKENLGVAVYIIQNIPCLYESAIKEILRYFMNKMINNLAEEEFNSICGNVRIIQRLIGLNANKIKSIIVSFKKPNILKQLKYDESSFIKSILAYRPKNLSENSEESSSDEILLSREAIYTSMLYLFEQSEVNINREVLSIISTDAEDSLDAEEIEKIFLICYEISLNPIPEVNPLFLALYRLLELKAKPYLVKETRSVVKSNVSLGSGNLGNGGLGVSVNLPNRELKNHSFNIIKTLITDKSKWQMDDNYGDDFSVTRKEYCNSRVPSFLLLSTVIKYHLLLNNMICGLSYESIIRSQSFLLTIKWTKPSCFAVRDIVNKICYFASVDGVGICNEIHINKALKALKFNPELYKQLDSYDINEDVYIPESDTNSFRSGSNLLLNTIKIGQEVSNCVIS